jgi:hypothetical protein
VVPTRSSCLVSKWVDGGIAEEYICVEGVPFVDVLHRVSLRIVRRAWLPAPTEGS